VSATFMICVHDFPRGEVSVKVDVMEFGHMQPRLSEQTLNKKIQTITYVITQVSVVYPQNTKLDLLCFVQANACL